MGPEGHLLRNDAIHGHTTSRPPPHYLLSEDRALAAKRHVCTVRRLASTLPFDESSSAGEMVASVRSTQRR